MEDHTTRDPRNPTPTDRFWKSVNAGLLSDCWEWQGAKRNGYGVMSIAGKVIYTHRFSYDLHYGPLPQGKEVCHTCNNRLCANPYHLFAGTRRDNIKDMYAKGRGNTANNYGGPKITEDDVRQIRQLAAQGVHYPVLAAQFGVTIPAISLIVTRKRWPHVK